MVLYLKINQDLNQATLVSTSSCQTHEIYESFDDAWEVSGVFLDISKAFDKV